MTTSDNISAIEKAMEGVELVEWFVHGRYIGTKNHMSYIGECRDVNGNWSDDAKSSKNGRYIAACNPVAMSAILAEARKVETLTGIGSAQDLIADWLGEGTDDLPDDTPVRIEIGKRTIISDTLGSLRRARTLLNGGSDAQPL